MDFRHDHDRDPPLKANVLYAKNPFDVVFSQFPYQEDWTHSLLAPAVNLGLESKHLPKKKYILQTRCALHN